MKYEEFYMKARECAKKAQVRATIDHVDGRHIARFSDGTTVIGNIPSKKVTVRWGDGHTAQAQWG